MIYCQNDMQMGIYGGHETTLVMAPWELRGSRARNNIIPLGVRGNIVD